MKVINFSFHSGIDVAFRYMGARADTSSAALDHDYFDRDFRTYQVDKSNKVSEAEAEELEKETREQSNSFKWREERKWRLTASNFGQICKATESRDLALLCKTLYDPPLLNNAAVNHGKTYETVALKKFSEVSNRPVHQCGLFVNSDFSFLGGSPDGVVDDASLVEIKCPFNGRNSRIAPGKYFPFLEAKPEGGFSLRKNHNYYFQIMGQLAISKRKSCFFVVFTLTDFFVEEIFFNPSFFKDEMLPKLLAFYENHYRPFVAAKL